MTWILLLVVTIIMVLDGGFYFLAGCSLVLCLGFGEGVLDGEGGGVCGFRENLPDDTCSKPRVSHEAKSMRMSYEERGTEEVLYECLRAQSIRMKCS